MYRNGWISFIFILTCICLTDIRAEDAEPSDKSPPVFSVGFAKRDITPQHPMPMWGYGARHAMLSEGALDTLFAKALVLHAGKEKLAIVGLDLGRGPTRAMTDRIRQEISEKAGIGHVMISGSHTHHGPCIELLDREGYGKGTFDAAVAYNNTLPDVLIEAILEADRNVQPAQLAVTSKEVPLNRNRQMKHEPKITDSQLSVIRFDDVNGKSLAILVNFAAHPVMTDTKILKFSADYPGFLQKKVEAELSTNCVFMQGASGDLSPNPPGDFRNPQAFGELLAGHVVDLVRAVQSKVPAQPSIRGKVDHYLFPSRIDYGNPVIAAGYEVAFYPELVRCFLLEVQDGVTAESNTVLLNGDVALVGGSGEFFCQHSRRLKERNYLGPTLFFGYCNDHNMYFPTIEAIAEGGYGADPPVSPAAVGAGEAILNRVLINLFELSGKIHPDSPRVK